MKKISVAILVCVLMAVGISGCGSSTESAAEVSASEESEAEESADEEEVIEESAVGEDSVDESANAEESVVEEAAEVETLSPEEYLETVHTFAYQVNDQLYVLATLGEYMTDDLSLGKSQEECLEDGLKQLEEADGIDQTYITVGANTIQALCQQLTPPPDEYIDLYNDVLVPLENSYVDFYNFVVVYAGNYESQDDCLNAMNEVVDNANAALAAYTNYFSNGEETVTAEPDASATKALDEYIANGYEYPSRGDFVDQLVYIEGYSEEVAEATVAAYNYDWDALAVENLLVLLEDYVANSPRDLRNWMELDEFTEDEIEYALETADVDWNDLAIQDANYWNNFGDGRDRDNIIQNLLLDGFTQEQAEYGADHMD